MELLKNFFKDDEKIIGLCAFKKQPQKVYSYEPKFNATKLVYCTNTKNNFFLLQCKDFIEDDGAGNTQIKRFHRL